MRSDLLSTEDFPLVHHAHWSTEELIEMLPSFPIVITIGSEGQKILPWTFLALLKAIFDSDNSEVALLQEGFVLALARCDCGVVSG